MAHNIVPSKYLLISPISCNVGRDALIKDLTTKLARKDPLFRAGKSAGFDIMTRDEAEKEMEELQATLKQYKEVLKERDRQLKEKDEQAEELRQEGQTPLLILHQRTGSHLLPFLPLI